MIAGGNPTLFVSDVGRAVRFYVETLGFKLALRGGDDFASIDAGDGLLLALHRASPGTPRPGVAGSVAIALDVEQKLEDVIAVLENRGVKFREPPVGTGALRLAFFSDPDGNALCLREPKAP